VYDMHMVAAKLGCKRIMVVTRWATSHLCFDRLRKQESLVEASFLARKATLALSRLKTTKSAEPLNKVCLYIGSVMQKVLCRHIAIFLLVLLSVALNPKFISLETTFSL